MYTLVNIAYRIILYQGYIRGNYLQAISQNNMQNLFISLLVNP